MATATTLGPIRINEINNVFYVGLGGFDTIQAAVDYVQKYNAGVGQIVVVQGYGYTEQIGNLVNGLPYISDQRDSQIINWRWDGTINKYVPAGVVVQGVPLNAPGSLLLGFSAAGTGGAGTASLMATSTTPGLMPALNIQAQPADLAGGHTFFRLDRDTNAPNHLRVQAPQALYLLNDPAGNHNLWVGEPYQAGGRGMEIRARSTEGVIDFQGETVGSSYDQTIRLNFLGGNLELGMNATLDEGGNLIVGSVAAVDGLVKGFGFSTPDMTASYVSIGTGGDNSQIPVVTLINATAPANQRMWIMAALTDQLIFTAETDGGEDFFWMQALRTGDTVNKVIITPQTDVKGLVKAFGFSSPDMTASYVSIGTGGNNSQIPVVSLINAKAPADQRLWIMAALTDKLIFSAETDGGGDTFWMQALRTGNAVNKVIITPPTDVIGVLTSQGSPVRTFANSPDGGGVPANVALLDAANIFTQTQTVEGLVKAYGFSTPDMTASHVSIGAGGASNQIPVVTLINATAPADQRMWIMAALTDKLIFSAETDGGGDTFWMQALRAGNAVNKVIITPPTDVIGVLTSQGSPVRTFANSPDGGGGGGSASIGTAGQLQMVGATPGSFAASALSDVSGAVHSSGTISIDSDQATLFLNGASSGGVAQVQFQATGTSRYGLILWGQGNGAGLYNVLGLYDGTRGAMIWNINDSGDMFFNTPLTNVSAGVGAAASIDHLGNAAFANLSSSGSPVRTLANTPDSGGGHPSQGPGNAQSGSLQFGTGDGNFAASYCGYNLGTGDMTQPGQLVCNYVTLTAAATSSAPVAGAAPVLPAAPLGYWSMRFNGTQVVIPFYAAGAEARPSNEKRKRN